MRPRGRPASPSIVHAASGYRPCPGKRCASAPMSMARKLIGAGFARGERLLITADTWPGFFDAFFGAQYAGLLPVPVSIPVGIGGKEAYLDQLRRQFAASGAVAAVGLDELAGFLAEAAAGVSRGPPARRHGRARTRCRRSRSTCGRSGPPTPATSSSRRAARAIRTACRSPRRALMANLAGHHRPGRPRRGRGRSRGELAAALSRHGPDRLPAGAARRPALDRLHARRATSRAGRCSG